MILFGINSNSCYSMMELKLHQNNIVQTNDNIIRIIEQTKNNKCIKNTFAEKFLDRSIASFRYFNFPQDVNDSIKKCIGNLLDKIEIVKDIRNCNVSVLLDNCLTGICEIFISLEKNR